MLDVINANKDRRIGGLFVFPRKKQIIYDLNFFVFCSKVSVWNFQKKSQ